MFGATLLGVLLIPVLYYVVQSGTDALTRRVLGREPTIKLKPVDEHV
jgi:hypothetical protein